MDGSQGRPADAGGRSRFAVAATDHRRRDRSSHAPPATTRCCRRALERLVDSGVGSVVAHFQDELASLVSGTIARWDADETSRRLELLLGPDLQFIRINGTIVGALAGLGIHAIGQLL